MAIKKTTVLNETLQKGIHGDMFKIFADFLDRK